ncbi:hypothetical protein LTR78_000826 [Recurvomyces mirabilis]|uniref:RBR-type E3 ubiquitin transferase n=1 Tax=Recurvomyces mirabilis TaxID=574656 RepID=A0AAE0WVY4_9PEZI|nr:hypothetical protein LTR78_000826 [Recurvomyces mirabilis]KAK5158795.1 hypothetical protein LTS14_002903 [Recurvomyces mirabilis]
MSALKRFVPWSKKKIAPSEDQAGQYASPDIMLARSNAKLQKRGKGRTFWRSSANLADSSDGSSPQSSRTNSFEPGESLLDFDVEAREMEALRQSHRPRTSAGHRSSVVGDGSMASKLGLSTVNMVPPRHRREPSNGSSSTSSLPRALHIPAISDLDWGQLDDNEARAVFAKYSKQPLFHNNSSSNEALQKSWISDSSSPVDSALNMPGRYPPSYSGKGKGRALDDGSGDHNSMQAHQLERWMSQQCQLAETSPLDSDDEENRLEAQRLQKQLEEEAEEEARLAAARKPERDCNVCGEIKDVFDFPAKAPASKCEHHATTCVECLESWMASEFETKGTESLKCPECPSILEYEDVQRAASSNTFLAYDKMATRNALSALDEFAWCLGPSCDNGQLNPENNNFMDCASCGYKQCLKHKVPWHKNETCDQYDYRTSGKKAKDEEAKTEAMLNTMSKQCPNKKCGWRIEKTGGCEHMTCKRCAHQFCWQCLADHSRIKMEGNTAHETWCKFHSDSLNASWPFNAH